MKKIKNWVIGGIENKVFNLILAAVILTIIACMAVAQGLISLISGLTEEMNLRQEESIAEITSSVMDSVVDESMSRSTQIEAMLANELFNGLKNRVTMLGDYGGKLFADPESVELQAYAGPDPASDGEVTAQLILADGVEEAEIADRIGLAANLSDMMISLYGTAGAEINSCFVALPEGAFLVVDDRSASKFDEKGEPVSYDCRTRPWYQQAVEAGGLIFTDVEIDAFTGDVGIVSAMPIYDESGALAAVVGSDLFLTSMQSAVKSSEENGGFVCVINEKGHVVFSPKEEGILSVVSSEEASDLRQHENAEFAGLIEQSLQSVTPVSLVTIGDKECYVMGAPVETVGWALLSVFEREAADQPVQMLQGSYRQIAEDVKGSFYDRLTGFRLYVGLLLLAIAVLAMGGAVMLGRRIVTPLNTITKRIASLSANNMEFKMEDIYRTGDEIEVLAESFASLSHKTVQYVEEVKRVTAEKERIGTELHMANQIQESMLPSIFPAFPERKEFDVFASMEPARDVGGDFYDFFLIDDDHLCLVMADVSGKGIPAALFMMISKIILQSCAMLGRSAGEILTKTNEALCSNNRMEMFVTVWVGILELSTGKLTAANAGHEYPVIYRAGNRKFELYKDRHGLVIGAMDGIRYREYELQLEPGDQIFVYTDGVTEATNAQQQLFGTERMVNALNTAAGREPWEVLKAVHGAVDVFVGDAEQADDLTMLCIEFNGKTEPQ